MAFGRVFALFDAMTAYLILINPWGSEDESGASGAPSTASAPSGLTNVVGDHDAGGSAALAPAMPFQHITPDRVPDDVRDLIERG